MQQKVHTILLGLVVVGLGIVAVRQEQFQRRTEVLTAGRGIEPTDATLELRAIDAWMIHQASERFDKLPDQEKAKIMDEAQKSAHLLAGSYGWKGGASKLSLLGQTEATPSWSWMYPQNQPVK